MEAIMRFSGRLCLLLGALLVPVPLLSQNVNPMHPEEIEVQKHASPDDMRARASNLQLQKDAKELAGLCASVSQDMEGLKQGLLSKDSLEKLKRLEKLSKRVREKLTQTSVAP
jgi:hypothetical protein